MKTSQPDRQPHAVLDKETRKDKANKIRTIIGNIVPLNGASILEIGTGSGIIAQELAAHVGSGKVYAIDVCDQRLVKDDFEFTFVNSTTLPYPDRHFDIVITNHVIEHVGDNSNQISHLREIRRVLKDDGIGYLAVPNRWRIIEPHFKLPLLSWFPQKIADKYVQLLHRGSYYDCRPLSHTNVIELFNQANLFFEEKTYDAMKVMLAVESLSFLERILLNLPEFLKRMLHPIIPTLIYTFKKNRLANNRK